MRMQQYSRQIPRLQSGPQRVPLGSDKAKRTVQNKSARVSLGRAREGRKDGQGRTEGGDPVKVDDYLHLGL